MDFLMTVSLASIERSSLLHSEFPPVMVQGDEMFF